MHDAYLQLHKSTPHLTLMHNYGAGLHMRMRGFRVTSGLGFGDLCATYGADGGEAGLQVVMRCSVQAAALSSYGLKTTSTSGQASGRPPTVSGSSTPPPLLPPYFGLGGFGGSELSVVGDGGLYAGLR